MHYGLLFLRKRINVAWIVANILDGVFNSLQGKKMT